MKITMPQLDDGKTYTGADVSRFVAPKDIEKVMVNFPRDILDSRSTERILFEYIEMPANELRSSVERERKRFSKRSEDRDAVQTIKALLGRGEPAYLIFVEKNDPEKQIIEGKHRAVAMMDLSAIALPVALTKYADW